MSIEINYCIILFNIMIYSRGVVGEGEGDAYG